MERALLARVYGISDPTDLGDPQYVDGLRTAIAAAIEYAHAALGTGEEGAPAIPAALLTQARLAAQNGITLDIVLRRYVGGFTVLVDFVLREAAEDESILRAGVLRPLLHSHSALLDRLLDALSDEHRRASEEQRDGSSALRRLERVRRLLDGELLDTSEFGYPFEGWHLGIVATGPEAPTLLRRLAGEVDRIALLVEPDSEIAWVWLGGRLPLDLEKLASVLSSIALLGHHFAIGEPGQGLEGWRLSHRQAAAALPVAQRADDPYVRYADVALLSTALQDDLLVDSLKHIYLEPLEAERDGGVTLRRTLRAYLASDQNLTSAASLLDVSRRTVSKRLLRIEELFGRPLRAMVADLDTALRLNEAMDQIVTSDRR